MRNKPKVIEFYRDYIQQSLVYDAFFVESLNSKLEKIQIYENDIKNQLPLKNKKDSLNKIAWMFQALTQTKDCLPLIVNAAIITSFQIFETFFFRLYKHNFKKDYMKGDFEIRIKNIDNHYTHSNNKISNILGNKIFLSVLEYNKRRNLFTHSGGKITTTYMNFLRKYPTVYSYLKSLDKLDKIQQNYKIGTYMLPPPKYYMINQMLLDLAVTIIYLHILYLEENNFKNYEKYVLYALNTIFINKKYLLGSSVFICLLNQSKEMISLSIRIYGLFALGKVDRGGFEKEKKKEEKYLLGELDNMTKFELFMFYLVIEKIEKVKELVPRKHTDIISCLNSEIFTSFINKKSNLNKLKKDQDFRQWNLDENKIKLLDVQGFSNLNKII